MEPKYETIIQNILQPICALEGCRSVCFAHREGQVLFFYTKDPNYTERKISLLAREVLFMGNKVLLECAFGKPEWMVVEGEEGSIYLRVTDRRGFYLALFTSSEFSIGVAAVQLQDAIGELNTLVDNL